MKITYHTSGNAMLEFDAIDDKQAIQSLSFWQSLPETCPKCGKDLRFFFRSPQNNDYYGLICEGTPAHETNFGQYKTGGGLYYKNEWQNAFASRCQDQENELTEPTAELNRLREAIQKEWNSKERSQTYDSVVRERFGVSPEHLKIAQLRQILEKLQGKK